jgi:sterol desaturase/sphingolipid hydroxylase (fatty acid hydroxylase superfamily)
MYLVSLAWLFFAHANLRLELGRWSWMGTAPQLHRLHHSADPAHTGTNFAQFFPLLDVAFGTYRAPAAGEFPQTGIGFLQIGDGAVVLPQTPSASMQAIMKRESELSTACK